MNTVLLIQADPFVAHYLRTLIEAAPGMKVVRTVATIAEARQEIPRAHPDVLLADLPSHGADVSALSALRGEDHGGRPLLMVIAMSVDDPLLLQAMRLGCDAYHAPGQSASIAVCIERMLDGESAMSPTIARGVQRHFDHDTWGDSDFVSETLNTLHLAPTEGLVLRWLAEGRLAQEVASRLDVSVHSIGRLTRSIYRKLQLDVQAGELSLA